MDKKQYCIICTKYKTKMYIRDYHFAGQGICKSCEHTDQAKEELGLD